jgi:ribosome-binding protein aMBF1 (putative translation factor)
MSYEHQDWIPVTIGNSSKKKEQNKQKQNPVGTKHFKNLIEDDIPTLNKITHEQKITLISARGAVGMSQNDLAKKLNVNVSIIKEYENGTVAQFNKTFYNKLLRTLGVSHT